MFGSRLPAISSERLIHFFMRVGATAKGSSLGVMVDILCCGLRHQDEAAFARVTCLCSMERFFLPAVFRPDWRNAGKPLCRKEGASERTIAMAKNTICLWYDRDAEEAARFYAETFPDSAVGAVIRAPGDYPDGKQGDVLVVEFTVAGVSCMGLNGGTAFRHKIGRAHV